MPINKSEKGKKRVCENCSTRWYDFFKKPILCPTCKHEFVETNFYSNSSVAFQNNLKKVDESDESKDKLSEYSDTHDEDTGDDDREMISIEEIEEDSKD